MLVFLQVYSLSSLSLPSGIYQIYKYIFCVCNKPKKEVIDQCQAHCKTFKHKKILVSISSFWLTEYDESDNTMNSQPAPKNKLFKLNT